jgi:hypothetical protein
MALVALIVIFKILLIFKRIFTIFTYRLRFEFKYLIFNLSIITIIMIYTCRKKLN